MYAGENCEYCGHDESECRCQECESCDRKLPECECPECAECGEPAGRCECGARDDNEPANCAECRRSIDAGACTCGDRYPSDAE